MPRAIHTFDNGVRVYEDQLWVEQRARYEKRNVHEAEEEDIFVDLIGRLPPKGCYVDVGAAIGYYLMLARKLAPRLSIHGVEPLERHRRLLRENLALNGLTDSDFKIHPEGLTSSEGSQAFLDRGYSSKLAPVGEKKNVSLSRRWKGFLESIGLRRPKNRHDHHPDDHARYSREADRGQSRSRANRRAGPRGRGLERGTRKYAREARSERS